MTTTIAGNARLTEELLEMATDMHASGIMHNVGYKKITMRHLGDKTEAATFEPLTGEESARCESWRI